MSFYAECLKYKDFNFDAFLSGLRPCAIERILAQEKISSEDFLSLLSKQAVSYLEPMAHKAQRLTLNHFGKVISLYAPLYLANFCVNDCVYCGFKQSNAIDRKKLSFEEVEAEAKQMSATGLRHVLILTGESREYAPLEYIKVCVDVLKKYFTSITIEIYPLQKDEYAQLIKAGVDGVTIYQETYDEALYRRYHSSGPKADYRFRLDTPSRAAQAGMRTVGIGALLGLGDFRREIFFTGMHAAWLQDRFPDVELSVSLPRIQPQTGDFIAPHGVGDRELVQMLLALRLFLPRVGITISTRESHSLRRNLIGLGVTRMSAGSRTEVGGYAHTAKTEGQFTIADTSTVDEVRAMICQKGYQPVSKDWQIV